MPPSLANVSDTAAAAGPAAPVPFARIECPVPLAAMQTEVQGLLQAPWHGHVNQRDYRGGWDVLPLRCQQQHVQAHPLLQSFSIASGEQWQDLPVLETCPALRALLHSLPCPLKSVRLMRLKADSEIKPHRDHGLGIEFGQARLHLPIQSSDDILFIVDGQIAPMRAGELWYFNADLEHQVLNRGREDRINLVIDCVADAWLLEKIATAPAPRHDRR